jgi:Ribosomal protein S8
MVNDTVGDFIIQLKNAGMVGKKEVSLPYSKHKHAIATVLQKAGYVADVQAAGEQPKKTLVVHLQYGDGGAHRIQGVKRISKPGRRLYAKAADIYPVKFGKGRLILSTPAGILTDEEARQQNVGGEQLFMIW